MVEPGQAPLRGVITSHLGVAVEVALADGTARRVRVQRKSGHVVGDDVEVTGERLVGLPRRSELRRRSPMGGIHVVAANLDVLGIVVALDPIPLPGLIDRAAVAARVAGIAPFLIINKADLDPDGEYLQECLDLLAADLPVFAVSASSGAGLPELAAFLQTRGRGALVGPSGVGKSSLLNALVPGADLTTRELSEAHGTGRHTTTVSTLLKLPLGGELADTPGVREYGLVEVSPRDLAQYFVGFDTVEGACRFRDCLHEGEPGGAIMKAVDDGRIPEERYASYRSVLGEAKANTVSKY